MPSEPDRVLDALTDSSKSSQKVTQRVESLERRFEGLDQRMECLEREMGSMNAHLDNLVREAQITNTLLREDVDLRKEEARIKREQEKLLLAHQIELEKEHRLDQRAIEKDKRETWKKVGSELWLMFRQPIGFLVAGIVAWFLYAYLGVPQATLSQGASKAPVVQQTP